MDRHRKRNRKFLPIIK